MRKIYLIRHGEPVFEGNIKRCIGQIDIPLSAAGEKEILWVKDYLSNKKIEKIYSSSLSRCKKSAELISLDKAKIHCMDELREINMGDWENKTFDEIKERYPDDYKKRGEDFANFTPKNGESFLEALERGKKAFEYIINDSTGNVAVVSHAGLNRAILCWLLSKDLNNLFKIKQPYGCINIINENNGKIFADEIGINPNSIGQQ